MSAAHEHRIARIRERHAVGDPPHYYEMGTVLAVIDELQQEIATIIADRYRAVA